MSPSSSGFKSGQSSACCLFRVFFLGLLFSPEDGSDVFPVDFRRTTRRYIAVGRALGRMWFEMYAGH
jgi:hypothetical protein